MLWWIAETGHDHFYTVATSSVVIVLLFPFDVIQVGRMRVSWKSFGLLSERDIYNIPVISQCVRSDSQRSLEAYILYTLQFLSSVTQINL
jgi:hypothetical protein